MTEVTARDKVHAAVWKTARRRNGFKLKQVRLNMDIDDRPSDETIRRVLRSLVELGVLKHTENSPYYELSDDYR
jgi:Fe2+ or Zn2+ uptake regulation protein